MQDSAIQNSWSKILTQWHHFLHWRKYNLQWPRGNPTEWPTLHIFVN